MAWDVWCGADCISHQIEAGDTYWTLKGVYGSTVDAIRRCNPWYDENRLPIGCSLCIPIIYR